MFVIEYAAVNPKPKPNPYNILLKKIRVVDTAVILLNSVFYLYVYSIEKLGGGWVVGWGGWVGG